MTGIAPTTTPWRVDPKAACRIVAGENDTVGSTAAQSDLSAQWEANAAFIVVAANTHDDLVKTLKLALEYWAHRQQRYKNRAPAWVTQARLVLAKAEADR